MRKSRVSRVREARAQDVLPLAALGLILLLNASSTCPAQESQKPKDAVDRASDTLKPSAPIRALLPRDPTGHQFVVYADCCSGGVHPGNEANFRLVNTALAQLKPMPEFICFPGDNIMGEVPDYQELRRQWRYWKDHEMDWLDKAIAFYPTTSNHNTYDAESEDVWREVFDYLPSNGPDDQKGLSYYIRKDGLLMVFVNTSFSGLGGDGHIEHRWLNQVLTEHRDATRKYVFGHHPIYPVNGYALYNNFSTINAFNKPRNYPWIVFPDEGRAFWDVLVRHGVTAYICSHIIAFDVQVREGVLQILTGGAGTIAGPGGFMPGETEYLHFVQMAVDQQGLRYQVVDEKGAVRERLSWPFQAPAIDQWRPFKTTPPNVPAKLKGPSTESPIVLWRIRGRVSEGGLKASQTLISGWRPDPMEGPSTVWIGLDPALRLTVELIPVTGHGVQVWRGPFLDPQRPFDLQIAIHSGMGPGGILWRQTSKDAWTSLDTSSARGAESILWPDKWAVGHGSNGKKDQPFRGSDLSVSSQRIQSP